jgi:hypothetical protein
MATKVLPLNPIYVSIPSYKENGQSIKAYSTYVWVRTQHIENISKVYCIQYYRGRTRQVPPAKRDNEVKGDKSRL